MPCRLSLSLVTFPVAALLMLTPLACADGGVDDAGHDDDHDHDDDAGEHDHDEQQEVTLRFKALLGGADFACGQDASDVGTTASTVSPKGLMFYISNVKLLDAEGNAADFEIVDQAPYQGEGVALLDFEDGTGACQNGTAETNTDVDIVGHSHNAVTAIRFTVGVPFALNHQDVTNAPAPLNLSTMWWNWNGGYKFLSLDFATTTALPGGWSLHVGSTGCTPEGANDPTSCASENRIEITLENFDTESSEIVLDLDAVLAAANVDSTTAPGLGCMSGPTDVDCPSVFPKIGLAHGATPAETQSAFRLE